MRPTANLLLLLALLVWSCSSQRAGRDASLPDLPRLEFDGVPAAVREQIHQAYQAALTDPQNPETNGRLGMVLHSYSQYESAEVAYRRARKLQPKRFEWAYYLGIVQSSNGRGMQAAESMREALQLRPDYVPARLRLADILLAQGRLPESRKLYEAATANKEARLTQAHYGLGRVLLAQGDTISAIEHLRRACELSPTFGAAHYALALAHQKSGNAPEAKRHLALHQNYRRSEPQIQDPVMDAVKELNSSATQHLQTASNLEQAGRLEEALAAYLKALELDPKLSQAHVNLIILYGKLGREIEAEKHYLAAIELNPTLAPPHYNFGVLLYNRGNHQEAAFRKALGTSTWTSTPTDTTDSGILELTFRLPSLDSCWPKSLM